MYYKAKTPQFEIQIQNALNFRGFCTAENECNGPLLFTNFSYKIRKQNLKASTTHSALILYNYSENDMNNDNNVKR